MSNQQMPEFDIYFNLFDYGRTEQGTYAPDDWALFRSPEAIRLVREKAAGYGGLISVSHFLRAFEELKRSNSIRQIRTKDPLRVEASDTLTVEAYRKMPSAETIRRWREDSDGSTGFRSQVQSLIDRGLI